MRGAILCVAAACVVGCRGGGDNPTPRPDAGGLPVGASLVPSPAAVALVGGTPPPDPTAFAPPVDQTVATSLDQTATFLYEGPTAIQTGVAPGAIKRDRLAVLRGRVLGADGAGLPAVKISVVDHAELGWTLTRADGSFDLVVNGGGVLVVRYAKDGLISVERAVTPPWRDFAHLPELVLRPFDEAVATVRFDANGWQVARAKVVTDGDGQRQATLIFPPGTKAKLVLPNGTERDATELHVRATEYTQGATGRAAMPADLPPQSAYTYAVELSADEAVAAGATETRFSKPVAFYLENFLGFPAGSGVPTGYYDKAQGAWVASKNGRVVKVVSVAAGLAELDINGDNRPDATETLGIADGERAELGRTYAPGTSLWRVSLEHFSPWDCNWPFGLAADAIAPILGLLDRLGSLYDALCKERGSIIGCEDQSLGEIIDLAGTDFALAYQSTRVPGRRDAYALDIPITPAEPPPSLVGARLEIEVAGQKIEKRFTSARNQAFRFEWNGKDVYGRPVQGSQPITVRLGYEYQPAYYATPAAFEQSFGRFAGEVGPQGSRLGYARDGANIVLWQTWRGAIGPWNQQALGLGGWSLSAHHSYDFHGRVLYRGDGGRQSGAARGKIIHTVVGDCAPETESPYLMVPYGIAARPDGGFYVADGAGNQRITLVPPNREAVVVAGNGDVKPWAEGAPPQGVPAAESDLGGAPGALALGPDGSLYMAIEGSHRVLKLTAAGRVRVVAGNGEQGSAGDGGPARAAELNLPGAIAVGPDGSLYIAGFENRVRRVGTDGRISTVAGTGRLGLAGDGLPATKAELSWPRGLAVARDGTLYIADTGNHRIRRVLPDGRIETYAGTTQGFSGDGGSARQAKLDAPTAITFGYDGALYVLDAGNLRVRRIGLDGKVRTVAGKGMDGFEGDGGLATRAAFREPKALGELPDGSLLIADSLNCRVRRVGEADITRPVDGAMVPSTDSDEIYVFDGAGRHARTVEATTGVVLYTFGYGPGGTLARVTDVDGNVTTIERDASGKPKAIVGPYGHRIELGLDGGGWLSQVKNPAGEAIVLTYAPGGLLASFTDARGGKHVYEYDDLGRLKKDTNPDGGSITLARSGTPPLEAAVRVTSTLARTAGQGYQLAASGELRRESTGTDGKSVVSTATPDGGRNLTFEDGTRVSAEGGIDPRFGGRLPSPSRLTVVTPRGRKLETTFEHDVALARKEDPLSLTRQTERITVNGKTSSVTYDRGARTVTVVSPAGRRSVTLLDAKGRPTKVSPPGLLPVELGYDARGRLERLTQGGRTSRVEHDAQGNVAAIIDPLGRRVVTTYDPVGRPLTLTATDGGVATLAYDKSGNVSSVGPPGRAAHRFDYSPGNRPLGYTPPGGAATRFTYNLDGQPEETLLPGGGKLKSKYDAAGRLDALWGFFKAGYDSETGQLTSLVSPTSSVRYAWDGALLLEEAWSGQVTGRVTRTYDEDLRVSGLAIGGTEPVGYRYDADGIVTAAGPLSIEPDPKHGMPIRLAVGRISEVHKYDGHGLVESTAVTGPAGELLRFRYVRDAVGRLRERHEVEGATTKVFAYEYDAGGRLAKVVQDGREVATYRYDTNGNRTRTGGVATETDAEDKLVRAGGATYEHTPQGEIAKATTEGRSTAFEYDLRGHLDAAVLPDGRRVEYILDPLGRRVGRKVAGRLQSGWLYGPALRPVAELDGSGRVSSIFVYGTHAHVPDVILKAGVAYRVLTDHLGSPRLIVHTETGEITQRLDYDAWGQILADTNPSFQPFRFAGGLWDPDTKLLHFGAREYDPATGRFLQRDPLLFGGGDTNLYAYAAGDPVNLIDPSGTSAESLLDRIGLGLDLAGMLPVVGEAADLASAALAMVRGDCAGAAMSIAAMVPVAGAAATAGKWSRTGKKLLGGATKMANHHIFPRQFKRFFRSKGLDIDKFTVRVAHETTHLKGIHGRGLGHMPGGWNARWAEFIDNNPNATLKDIYQFAGRLLDEFGLSHLPIRPY